MATALSFDDFAASARERGFDDVVVRHWAPHQHVETHTHPVSIEVVVVEGQVDLTMAGETRRYGSGEVFTVGQEVPHAEVYGPQGAVFWVARRSA